MTEEDRAEHFVVDGVRALLDGADLEALPSITPEALGRFFQQLLVEERGWSRSWWIDDAHPERVERIDDRTLELTGVFVPGDRRHQWIQPFRARFRLDPGRAALVSYRIRLGEASVAMDAVPFGAKRPRHWPDVTDWTFAFERGRFEV
jgi:hypothetical protein